MPSTFTLLSLDALTCVVFLLALWIHFFICPDSSASFYVLRLVAFDFHPGGGFSTDRLEFGFCLWERSPSLAVSTWNLKCFQRNHFGFLVSRLPTFSYMSLTSKYTVLAVSSLHVNASMGHGHPGFCLVFPFQVFNPWKKNGLKSLLFNTLLCMCSWRLPLSGGDGWADSSENDSQWQKQNISLPWSKQPAAPVDAKSVQVTLSSARWSALPFLTGLWSFWLCRHISNYSNQAKQTVSLGC